MKISNLPLATELNDEDVLPVVQEGKTKKVPVKKFFKKQPTDVIVAEDGKVHLMVNGEPIGDGIPLPNYEEELFNFRNQVGQISEVAETLPDETNLWSLGDVEVTGYTQIPVELPAGSYKLTATVSSTDTDKTYSCVRLYSDTTLIETLTFYRNVETVKTIEPSEPITRIVFYASSGVADSTGDNATYSNIIVIDSNATIPVLTAKDDVARGDVSKISYDMKYLQNPNLYNPIDNWIVGKYNYTTGNADLSETNHVRNIIPIELSSDKEYNIRTKSRAGNLYVFTYDADMNYLGYKSVSASETIPLYHITDVSYVNFVVADWASRYPNEPPQVMIWECEDATDYGVWLEYGDKGKYVKEKQTFTNEQIADIQNKMNIQKFNRARFDDRFNFIAYSVINNDKGPINTAEHFEYCGSLDCFTALKGDVQPTSDGGVIMCHDKGFTLDENGRITTFNADDCVLIHDMTTEQCQALEHRTPYNGEYCKVITFEKYIQRCKRTGKIAFITVRDQYIPEVIAHIMPILEKYRMIDRSIINSFTLSTLQAFREANESIMLSNVLDFGKVLTKAHINNAVSLGNCLINCFHFPSDSGWDLLDQSKEAIDYAIENDIRIYEGQTGSVADVDLLMEYGVMGTQMIAKLDTGSTSNDETLNQIEAQLDEIIETQNSYIGGNE